MRKPVLECWSVLYLKTSILVREHGTGLSLVVMVSRRDSESSFHRPMRKEAIPRDTASRACAGLCANHALLINGACGSVQSVAAVWRYVAEAVPIPTAFLIRARDWPMAPRRNPSHDAKPRTASPPVFSPSALVLPGAWIVPSRFLLPARLSFSGLFGSGARSLLLVLFLFVLALLPSFTGAGWCCFLRSLARLLHQLSPAQPSFRDKLQASCH